MNFINKDNKNYYKGQTYYLLNKDSDNPKQEVKDQDSKEQEPKECIQKIKTYISELVSYILCQPNINSIN